MYTYKVIVLIVVVYPTHRNLPQIVIQLIYMYQIGNIDVFAGSAMLFSLLSVIIGIFQQISRKMKSQASWWSADHNVVRINNHDQMYKMTIDCGTFRKYHIHCHSLLEKTICSVMGVDDNGWIEVFYTASAQDKIFCYFQVLKQPLLQLVASSEQENQGQILSAKIFQIGEPGHNLNTMFKEEFSKGLTSTKTASVINMDVGVEYISQKLLNQMNSM